MTMYPELLLYIDGRFHGLAGRESQEVRDPATLKPLGWLPWATDEDIAARWTPPMPPSSPGAMSRRWSAPMCCAASPRWRASGRLPSARAITQDNGKPLADAVAEVLNAAEHIEWHAEEGRRIYGGSCPRAIRLCGSGWRASRPASARPSVPGTSPSARP